MPTPLRLHVGDLQTYVTIMAGRCPELQGMALFASRVAAREEASQALQLALACSYLLVGLVGVRVEAPCRTRVPG